MSAAGDSASQDCSVAAEAAGSAGRGLENRSFKATLTPVARVQSHAVPNELAQPAGGSPAEVAAERPLQSDCNALRAAAGPRP